MSEDGSPMTDQAEEVPPDGDPRPAPQSENEAAPDPALPAEAARQPDAPAATEETGDQDASHEDDTVLTAADLAKSTKARRQMRQAGLESLRGTWFGGAARFGGPASFAGHAAARDVNIYYGSAGRMVTETGPVASEVLVRVRAGHVTSRSYARAEGMLRDKRLVVLRGAAGSGRRSAALFLLSEMSGDVNAISAKVALGSPDASGLRAGAGYLAEETAVADLMYTRLAAWSAELRQLDAYLVITVPASSAAEADTAGQFVVDHQPPDCDELVLSHLRSDVVHGSEAERLLGNNGAALACASSPRTAADLAGHILRIVRDGRPASDLEAVTDAMRRQRAQHLLNADRLKEPVARVEALYRRAALISVAVFAGLPSADAVAAAEVLAAKFIAIEFPDRAHAGREIFRPWRDLLASEPGIMIEESELPGRWGPLVSAQLRFSDPELHVVMIEELWEHYDAVRSPLLQWLRELAISPSDEAVRVRAAQIIGRLAIRDFDHICHRLILDLASSVNTRLREAAATALEAAAAGKAPHVWKLLAEWCREGNQHRQRTAIGALGTTIGERDPGATLDQLRQLVLRDTGRSAHPISEAVRRSVTELLSGPHQEAVVRALRSWADDRDPRLPALALRCVPPLAHVTDNSGHLPLLIALADSTALREDVAALFAASIEKPDTRQEAWTALRNLVTAAARDIRLTDALGQVLADLKRISPIAAEQLVFYLGLWARRLPELAA
jgi:hypothetical protein